jgi:glycosyltransferase involved in cell wall biosynthesis
VPLRISIITPSFNQGQFIERTIQSILEQTGAFELEYLVFDGGSTDETLSILRKYEDRLSWKSEPDKGQVDAVNKGLRAATGDLVGWVNSDDVLLPGALARVAEVFRSRPQTEWVHGQCQIIDAEDRVIRRWISAYKNWNCRRYSYARLLTENFISQMTVFWKRELLGQVGYLDPELKLAFDYDYWLRLARRSDPVFIDEPIACFRWYETSKSGSNFTRQFREDYEVARRHAPERRWLHLRKRWKNFRILVAYRLLSFCRRLVPSGRTGGRSQGAGVRGQESGGRSQQE